MSAPAPSNLPHNMNISNVAFVDGIPSAVLRDILQTSQSVNDLQLINMQRIESAPAVQTPPRVKSAGPNLRSVVPAAAAERDIISSADDIPFDMDPLLDNSKLSHGHHHHAE